MAKSLEIHFKTIFLLVYGWDVQKLIDISLNQTKAQTQMTFISELDSISIEIQQQFFHVSLKQSFQFCFKSCENMLVIYQR